MDKIHFQTGSQNLSGLLGVLCMSLCIYLLYHLVLFPLFRSDLRSIPGPALAKLTDLYRLLLVRTESTHEHHVNLHRRYGSLVRLGPNNVSISSPSAIPIIYNIRTRFPKSDFYMVATNMARGKLVPAIFPTRDESFHETMKRPIAQVYAMTSIKTYEPLVDSTSSFFFEKLEKLADEGKVFDLGTWLHWFAFDVITEITFGKRFGFLEREEDVDGIIQTILARSSYAASVGQMPWLDKLLLKNPLLGYISKQRAFAVVTFTLQQIEERQKELQDNPKKKDQGRDFLTKFLDIKNNNPDIPDFWIIAWCQQNIQAGSDSTAITLTAVIYHLLKNEDSMKTLLAELDRANLPSPIPWDTARSLPYLDACIKEALRLNPAVAIPLERVVPEGGVELDGKHLKAGTVVGMNAWVVHKDKEVFGEDADCWRPSRWIDASNEMRKEMERALFTFGAGSRVCLGRHISYLEMYKIIPELLTRFKFELAEPESEWTLRSLFFVYTNGVNVTVQRRDQKG